MWLYFLRKSSMQTKQAEWATQLRAIPENFRLDLTSNSLASLRHCPAQGEWSAFEVMGHFVDKMGAWQGRVELLSKEDEPEFPGYDQDAYVRENNYQHADPQALFEQLVAACESFAKVVETLPDTALARQGRHL